MHEGCCPPQRAAVCKSPAGMARGSKRMLALHQPPFTLQQLPAPAADTTRCARLCMSAAFKDAVGQEELYLPLQQPAETSATVAAAAGAMMEPGPAQDGPAALGLRAELLVTEATPDAEEVAFGEPGDCPPTGTRGVPPGAEAGELYALRQQQLDEMGDVRQQWVQAAQPAAAQARAAMRRDALDSMQPDTDKTHKRSRRGSSAADELLTEADEVSGVRVHA